MDTEKTITLTTEQLAELRAFIVSAKQDILSFEKVYHLLTKIDNSLYASEKKEDND